MDLYTGMAMPQGPYASRLEQRWAVQFARWNWDARYVGNECDWADFDVGGIRIEVKPNGREYVEQAAMRAENILIVEGSPGFCRWWFVDYTRTAVSMGISPQHVPFRFGSGQCPRMETVQEFIDRRGFRFE